MTDKKETTASVTDVGEFITDLDGGVFDSKLSASLSQVAAAVVDNKRVGEVSVKFAFKHIPGTSQVQIEHTIKYTRPTLTGKASEEDTQTTPMHVGKFGKLSLSPENQLKIFDREGQVAKN